MSNCVLITGGAQRLGAELVRTFAQAGWRVWLHYQNSQQLAQELMQQLNMQGAQVKLVQADLANEAQLVQMMAQTTAEGGLDVLINNASLFNPDAGDDFLLTTAKAQLDVNLIAPMYLGQLLAKNMVEKNQSNACIIHVLDQKVFNLNPDYFSYTLSKLALERAVMLQAQSLAPRVRVCGVAPGLMYVSGPQQPENFEIASRVNLRRMPTDPRDVAKACLFLATTPSITGVSISVDNGQHLVPLQRDVMFAVEDWLKDER